jgi:hypothetical protein
MMNWTDRLHALEAKAKVFGDEIRNEIESHKAEIADDALAAAVEAATAAGVPPGVRNLLAQLVTKAIETFTGAAPAPVPPPGAPADTASPTPIGDAAQAAVGAQPAGVAAAG